MRTKFPFLHNILDTLGFRFRSNYTTGHLTFFVLYVKPTLPLINEDQDLQVAHEARNCELSGGDRACLDCGWWDFGVNSIGA